MKLVDKRTGREVIDALDLVDIAPREGQVLLRVADDLQRRVATGREVVVGCDLFEWVPAANVELELSREQTSDRPDLGDR